MREVREKMYYIVHINYSVNRAYIFSYHKTRILTTNQAWKFVEDINNSVKIDGRILINNRSIREIKDDLEKNYLADCNFDNTKTIFLITNVVSDERGNDIIDYTDAEKKYEEDLELLLDENVAYDYPGNINVVDVNSFSEFNQEDINDSAAIQQEQSDLEKDLIKEDFVKFEEILKKNTFKITYFKGECKLTEELIVTKGKFISDEYDIDNLEFVFLDFLIYEFFPNSTLIFEEDKKTINVETRTGTIFKLRPLDWENRRCEYRYLHHYEISFCIF